MGWTNLNLLATGGALILFASFVLFLWNVLRSVRRGELAGDNPWDAGTLEWATSSPPPPHNFDRIPVVSHREPLWAQPGPQRVAVGLAIDRRELVVSALVDATPQIRETSPDPSIWPLVAALLTGITFIGSIFTPWAVVWGSPLVGAALIAWFWPKGSAEDEA
jgi:hypothetical protein